MPPEAAVATPPAETQAANPASDPQATSTPVVDAGTDGAQSQAAPDSTVQTADTTDATVAGSTPKPDATPATPALSTEQLLDLAEQRIQAREAERVAKEARERTISELRDLRKAGPKLARSVLDRIAEEAGIVIPVAYREELEDHIENLNLKAIDAAKIELGDESSKELSDEQQAFIDACYAAIDPAKRAEFTSEVNNKGHEDWVKAAAKYAPRSDGMASVSDLASQAVALADNAKYNFEPAAKTKLAEAMKGAKTPTALLEAVLQAGIELERAAPGALPKDDGARASEPGYTRAQITKMTRAQLDALPAGVFEKVMGI